LKAAFIISTLALGFAAPAMAQGVPEGAPEAPMAAGESASEAVTAQAGDTVYDPAGEVVGTVESVAGDNFVISTGANKASLPLSALAGGEKGPTIGMSKSQLDEAIQRAAPAN
jgi:hypothetical protein